MNTRLHNLTDAATRSQKSPFWSPVATPCFGNGLRDERELFLSLPQAVLAGKAGENLSVSNSYDTKSEYPAPPIAPASPPRKVTS